MEKGRAMFADVTHGSVSRADKRASKHNIGDQPADEPIVRNCTTSQSNIRDSFASNASVNSGQSIHFSSLSPLGTPFRSQQQLNRLSQWVDTQGQSQSLPYLVQTHHSSPLAPTSTPPQPCQILVNKSTVIDFEDSSKAKSSIFSVPSSAMVPQMPGPPTRGTKKISISKDSSRNNNAFKGDHEHTVKISGPSSKL